MKLLIYKVNRQKKAKSKEKSGGKSSLFGDSRIIGLFKSESKNVNRESIRVTDQLKYKGFNQRSSFTQKQKLSFERFMFFMFIITFTLLIVVQAALMSPTVRTFINGYDEFEGTPLGVEEYLYQEGEIGLKLLNGSPNGQLKILVNGDEAAAFNSSIVNLKVKDGDIVEIDASDTKDESEVVIISKSDNINADSANKRVRLKSGVKKLTQIRIE